MSSIWPSAERRSSAIFWARTFGSVRGESLYVVQLGELSVVVWRAVALKLFRGLLAELGAVDQEQHAPRAAELYEAVGGRRDPSAPSSCRSTW